ncbi:DUF2288 domain-containing protein [Crocosphaera watsonii WH 8501]|uniref:DUF2288 domain-containing protein n=5 Tax=Crocosphaera watsonii TaxID=263511 RepID=G5J467_CROWT|nr:MULTISPECIES: DUF2288 domain-containing protein [Crocosphaera]EAM51071.1 similar to Uncharacterized small conserved protein [Crocosphaera watsonii WH 8501]EHJ13025.1 hypothetical protein CWATWH0003_2290 [Crocosphaera watsonii WH 0003]MCH2244783.1 DUF2288 domain-containing protein [Crocosphaera sp.]NQZ62714.1 DUF2288 family protein [Crocosphaera sp.]CCQ53295.1 FIG00561481: hypothetical protein [Crocosphaera watsonii WH 8502]
MEELRKKLEEDMADVNWNDIKPHAQRDAVIVVNETLNLLDVGVAIAQDDKKAVEHWITEQLISKPSNQQLSDWNIDQTQLFKTLIVQPFVLVQSV